jgi:hypothetical protein
MINGIGYSIVIKGVHTGAIVEVVEFVRIFGHHGWRVRLLGGHNNHIYGDLLWLTLDVYLRPVSGLFDPDAPIINFKKSRKWSE